MRFFFSKSIYWFFCFLRHYQEKHVKKFSKEIKKIIQLCFWFINLYESNIYCMITFNRTWSCVLFIAQRTLIDYSDDTLSRKLKTIHNVYSVFDVWRMLYIKFSNRSYSTELLLMFVVLRKIFPNIKGSSKWSVTNAIRNYKFFFGTSWFPWAFYTIWSTANIWPIRSDRCFIVRS